MTPAPSIAEQFETFWTWKLFRRDGPHYWAIHPDGRTTKEKESFEDLIDEIQTWDEVVYG